MHTIASLEISISRRIISPRHPVFIIAEAGVNHNGDINRAKRLIDAACTAGADAVKFQSFKTEHLILQNVSKAAYQVANTKDGGSQYQMLKRLEIQKDKMQELFRYADAKGIICLSTPFDEESLDELDSINVPAYKIASTDLTNIPFLEKIAQKGKPLFLSTGMSYFSEVQMAVNAVRQYNKQLVLLQCTANYPISDVEANLRVIDLYHNHFGVLVGYSDHTMGIGAAPYAVAMGAVVIEKHLTLSTDDEGPDHKASLPPDIFVALVKEVRKVEMYMGTGTKAPTESEQGTRAALQKSLVAKKEIKKGEIFSSENIIAKRTGGQGISPLYYYDLIGKKALRDYAANDIIVNE